MWNRWYRPAIWEIKGFQCEQDYIDRLNGQQFFDFMEVPEL